VIKPPGLGVDLGAVVPVRTHAAGA
jgi:hypothetical protein